MDLEDIYLFIFENYVLGSADTRDDFVETDVLMFILVQTSQLAWLPLY